MSSSSASCVGTYVGIVALCLGAAACGVPPEQAVSSAEGIELVRVDMVQYSTPTPIGDPQQPSLRLVTVDLTVVFRSANHPVTLVIDFEAESGTRTHNELDLAQLSPSILDITDGQGNMKAPVTIPELGSLRYSVMLVDQSGQSSGVADGSFTVQESLAGSNGGQISEENSTTVTGVP